MVNGKEIMKVIKNKAGSVDKKGLKIGAAIVGGLACGAAVGVGAYHLVKKVIMPKVKTKKTAEKYVVTDDTEDGINSIIPAEEPTIEIAEADEGFEIEDAE